MKRVASLYLPNWPIDRLRRIERRHAPPAETGARAALNALGAEAAAERAQHCSVPREGGWRPGARWARSDPAGDTSGLAETREEVSAAIKALPVHRRPPQRELGRVSQAADNPFGTGPNRHGVPHSPETPVGAPAPLQELSRRTEAAEPLFRPGTRGWSGSDVQTAIDALPPHQRPSGQELSRRSEVVGSPFRPMRPDEAGCSLAQRAAMPPLQFPGEDMAARRAMRTPRPSSRDGHGGEAAAIAPPSLAQLAAMPAVQYPGEGPHPDNHGKTKPVAPGHGQGRFFQTGRTLRSVVARVCPEIEAVAGRAVSAAEPPLATVRKTGSRVELAAVCPAARALGMHPGMALTMARAQAPQLDARPADEQGDAADLRRLAELLARRWSPVVAISDSDGLFIDLTGVAHLRGGEKQFARRLVRLLARHGFCARVAVADSAGAAWALARYGDGGAVQIAPTGSHGELLSPLPPAALRLAPSALELLARLGVDSVGQLAAMPRGPLVRRFGQAIVARLDQALGHAPEPLDPVAVPQTIAVEQRFAEPIATADAIEHWLRRLVPRLCQELTEAGRGARSIEVAAARVDGVPQRFRVGLARATRDPPHILRLMLRRIEEVEPGFGIDALSLHVRRSEPLGAEPFGAALAEEAEPELATLIDAIVNRIGSGRLWRAIPVESDVPERSWGRIAPLGDVGARKAKVKQGDVRQLDVRAPDHPWHPRWRRPVRLLRHPERVDHVLAELPDQPPRRFTWRGQSYRVLRAEGPERITGEWWRSSAERHAVRDYFWVEDEGGQRFWLFRRGDGVRSETGDLSWYLHGR